MTSYLKVKPYRNPKLLALAKDAPCSLCDSTGTTVAAHSNYTEHGKGMGKKADDCYIAFLCYKCHMDIDQSKNTYLEKKEKWYLGMSKTYHWLLTNHHLKINPLAGCEREEYKDIF
jgi:hypothetical protein